MDNFIDELPQGQLDEWEAMDRIIPIGTEKICWTLAMGFAQICNMLCMDRDITFKPADFVPWANKQRKKKKRKSEYINPNQAAQMFKMAVQ